MNRTNTMGSKHEQREENRNGRALIVGDFDSYACACRFEFCVGVLCIFKFVKFLHSVLSRKCSKMCAVMSSLTLLS